MSVSVHLLFTGKPFRMTRRSPQLEQDTTRGNAFAPTTPIWRQFSQMTAVSAMDKVPASTDDDGPPLVSTDLTCIGRATAARGLRISRKSNDTLSRNKRRS